MTPFKGQNNVTNPFVKGKHNGQDIITIGTRFTEPWMVRATKGRGKVIEVQSNANNPRGLFVRVQYPKRKNYVVTYQHLARIDVHVGQKVKRGTRLGLAGDTGTDAKGVHLHFEVRTAPGEGGIPIDPSRWSGVPNVVGPHPGNDDTGH